MAQPMKVRRIRDWAAAAAGRVVAAGVFWCECLWVVGAAAGSTRDYRYARCGREMWERPSPLAGYFTTCGNLNGDGTFAYRVAGLPLTVQRLVLLGADKLRKPENRLYAGGSLNGSTWEARHELAQREVSAASAVCAVCDVAGGGLVVGVAAAVWE